jgi:hypothetical protein
MKMRMLSTEQGAATSLYCATAPELDGVTGRFYDNSCEREPSAVATPETGRRTVAAQRSLDRRLTAASRPAAPISHVTRAARSVWRPRR